MDTTIDSLSIEITSSAKSASTGINTLITKLQALNTTLTESTNKLGKLNSALMHIGDSTKNILAINTALKNVGKVKIDTSDVDVTIEKLKSANDLKNEMGGQEVTPSIQESPAVQSEGGKGLGAKLVQLNSSLTPILSKLSKIGGSAFEKLKGSVVGALGKLKLFGKTVKDVGKDTVKGFGDKSIKSIKRFGLALMGVRTTFTLIRKAASSYLSFDTQLSSQLSDSWNRLGALLAPALELVINLFSQATSYVAAFVKALTGVDLIANANAKAIKKMASDAKNALGGLAGFDQLNEISFNNNDSSASSISSGDANTNPFEGILEKIKSDDWYGVGMEVGKKFNDGLDAIDFSSIFEKAKKFAKNFGDLINGVFDGIDWSKLGSTISDTFIGVSDTINTLFQTIDFGNIGESFANLLLGIDWFGMIQSLITTIGTILVSSIDFIWGFVSTLLSTLWSKISNWFTSTPFGKEIVSIFAAAWGAIKSIWGVVQPFFQGIFDTIVTIMTPIKDQISNIFSTTWELIKITWDNVTGYFRTIFESIKYIFSFVSSVFKGDFEGAWNAIKGIVGLWADYFKNVWNNISKIFSVVGDFFKKTFTNAANMVKAPFNALVSFFKGIINTIKNVLNGIVGLFEGLVNKIISGINSLIGKLNSVHFEVPDWVPGIGGSRFGLDIAEVSEIKLPRLATGTNDIPKDGTYYLHKNEAVVPKKYNPAVNNQSYAEASQDTVNAIYALIDTVKEMETTNVVNIGNKKVYEGVSSYMKRQNNIYGTSSVTI